MTTVFNNGGKSSGCSQRHYENYVVNLAGLGRDFGAAWYRLASQDMGPHAPCIGDMVPPPQSWQYTLPTPSSQQQTVSYVDARSDIHTLLDESTSSAVDAISMINLAYRCASTFRVTDWQGGCNGA